MVNVSVGAAMFSPDLVVNKCVPNLEGRGRRTKNDKDLRFPLLHSRYSGAFGHALNSVALVIPYRPIKNKNLCFRLPNCGVLFPEHFTAYSRLYVRSETSELMTFADPI